MKAENLNRLIIAGFGHAGQTYLEASINLTRYINEIFIYDPKINERFFSKYKKISNIKISFLRTKFDGKLIDKNTTLIIAVSGRQKIEILKSIKSNLKLIILEKPPALNKLEFNFIKKKFDPKKIYFALHASKGIEVIQAQKILKKLKNKDLIGMSINQLFTDPYSKNLHNNTSLINSWTDSGINALSVIAEIFGNIIKKLKFNVKKSNLDSNNIVSVLFSIPSLKVDCRISTSWNLGIDLKLTQIDIPAKSLKLTLDHSKQLLYKGFSTQLVNKKAVNLNENRLKAHYYEVLKEAVVKNNVNRTHTNMSLISDNFYSVQKKIK
jgi:hypothetical protein